MSLSWEGIVIEFIELKVRRFSSAKLRGGGGVGAYWKPQIRAKNHQKPKNRNKFRSKPKTAYRAKEPEHIKERSGEKNLLYHQVFTAIKVEGLRDSQEVIVDCVVFL